MLHILIPTRNNPKALGSLLASFLSQGLQRQHIVIHIADASDKPIIMDQHVSRLLPAFRFAYRHNIIPDVNRQRLQVLAELPEGDPVLSIDDDLVITEGYKDALYTCVPLLNARPCIFGVTVDLTNERGYPDYRHLSKEVSTHAFSCSTPHLPQLEECAEAESFSATVGHMLCHAGSFYKVLSHVYKKLAGKPAAVIDDCAATVLARLHGGCVGMNLRAWHLGNDNSWWSPWETKRHAVDKLAAEVLSELTDQPANLLDITEQRNRPT